MTRKSALATLSMALATGLVMPALAQTETVGQGTGPAVEAEQSAEPANPAAQRGETSTSGDDIIVTARRRNERLQEVPVSVDAVTPALLEQNNITGVNQLSRVAPSLTIAPGQSSGRAVPHVAIRGLSQQEATIFADPSVPFYIGDIVAARAQGVNGALFDIASVEVLRGPQGTLFGRNSTGGAVVIRPQRPKDGFGGRASVAYSTWDTIQTEGVLNIPVTETLKLRLAAATHDSDGFFKDVLLGENIDEIKRRAFRGSVLFDSGGFENYFVYDFFHENDGGTPTFIADATSPTTPPPGTPTNQAPAFLAARNWTATTSLLAQQQPRGIYSSAVGLEPVTKVTTHTVANTASLQLTDQITLKNIVGFRRIKDTLLNDTDGTEEPLSAILRLDQAKQWTEEFQILGDMGRLNWIAGAYYFRETGRNQGISVNNGVDPGPIDPQFFRFEDLAELYGPTTLASKTNTDVAARNKSYAVFAQADLEVLDGLTATAGARINTDERSVEVRSRTLTACRFTLDTDADPTTPEVRPSLADCVFRGRAKFTKPTYNVGLRYQIDDDRMIYVAHRHGYRTGGFGSRAATEQGLRKTFKPEIVDDVEIGAKADWRPGGTFLRTNVAAYYAWYKDAQKLITDPTTTPSTTTAQNAASARVYGLEVEALFRPIPEIELTANYAYTNAAYRTFIIPVPLRDASDDPFARAPKNVYTLGARYTRDLAAGGTVSLGASYFHTDGYSGNESFIPGGYTLVDGYNLLNLDARWDNVLGAPFDLSVWANNVTKERYTYLFSASPTSGYVTHTPGEPRSFGLRATVHFGQSGD